ncbi:MAG: phenylalanine--tRNA ligase subunit alpha [Deferribacterota bacterium]|nr:phenylalanine--tRNA ligase subunit alpha [Deferribacterota bacterium]
MDRIFLEEIENINTYKDEIGAANNLEDLYSVKLKYLGKKGIITSLNKNLRDIPKEERRDYGRIIQETRKDFERLYLEKERELKRKAQNERLKGEFIDVSLPGFPFSCGCIHPITQIYYKIVNIFVSMGFEIAEGPEVEKEFYNFEALNIPKDHPARDMQDTFYIDQELLLRTHTSPVQVRVMEGKKPPIRIIAPGKVYRCDNDISHTPMFHQVEGLFVDKDVTFANLKATLISFIEKLFEDKRPVRFRPSYFPFTEPSAEVDIGCVVCDGKGCRLCGNTGWLEVLGCGMVHPNVFKAVHLDANKYSGYAFGLGIERIAMLLYRINDIRLFFENNLNFLRQF